MTQKPNFKFDRNSLLTIAVIISLILSFISLYISVEKQAGLTEEQKTQLKEIAKQLRNIQQKDLVLIAPLKTTVYAQKEIPANQVIPEDLMLVVNTTLPINTTLEAVSTKGEIMRLQLLEDLPIEGYVPIKAVYSLNDSKIKIDQQIPIESKFSLTFKVNVVYGQELNEIIQKIEELSK
ncbi:MAG: hypothetical protein N3D10_03775 [Candidatus Micrarchaeota archaeon]|nr:hypothetical protein [Candidatus Micrarchaeota archaeon]